MDVNTKEIVAAVLTVGFIQQSPIHTDLKTKQFVAIWKEMIQTIEES